MEAFDSLLGASTKPKSSDGSGNSIRCPMPNETLIVARLTFASVDEAKLVEAVKR